MADQIIQAANLDRPCKHANCTFAGTGDKLKSHEEHCKHRLVPCPIHLGCDNKVPFNKIFANEHYTINRFEEITATYPVNSANLIMDAPEDMVNDGIGHHFYGVSNLGDTSFIHTVIMRHGMIYAFTYIVGDKNMAAKYTVFTSIYVDGEPRLWYQNKVATVDKKKSDIVKEGILTIPIEGMSKSLMRPAPDRRNKNLDVQFELYSPINNVGAHSAVDSKNLNGKDKISECPF